MKRIPQEIKEPQLVSRVSFDADFSHGCVAVEFNPEVEEEIKDQRSGKSIRRLRLADISYRCVWCQFDSLDKTLIDKHLAMGQHPWKFNPFENPYGHIADVVIEGIDDYAAFIAEKEKR